MYIYILSRVVYYSYIFETTVVTFRSEIKICLMPMVCHTNTDVDGLGFFKTADKFVFNRLAIILFFL